MSQTSGEAGDQRSFATTAARELAAARVAVVAVGEKFRALASDAPPLQVAALADRLIAAAGEVYRHAHRVAEAHPRR
jgi:hypothetical protein